MVNGQAPRVGWVDVAKGICIIFVVMMHSTLGVEKAVGEAGWMGHVVAFAKPFRMPDFFLISGLFLSRVIDRDARTFIDRRVLHFAYFYVLWLVIQFAFKAPGMIAGDGAAEALRLFVLALTIDPFGTLWFVWLLPVFAVAVRLTRSVPPALVLATAALIEMGRMETGWVAIDEFASRFVYFYAGYLLAPAVFTLAAAAQGNPGASVVALLAWGLLNGWAVAAGWSEAPGIGLALGFLGAAAVVTVAALAARIAFVGPLLGWIGERSIVVYLAFFLPMAATRAVLVKTGIIPDVGTMSVIVTLVAVAIPFAIERLATRFGATFLFERPAWARLDRRAPAGRLQPAE